MQTKTANQCPNQMDIWLAVFFIETLLHAWITSAECFWTDGIDTGQILGSKFDIYGPDIFLQIFAPLRAWNWPLSAVTLRLLQE